MRETQYIVVLLIFISKYCAKFLTSIVMVLYNESVPPKKRERFFSASRMSEEKSKYEQRKGVESNENYQEKRR